MFVREIPGTDGFRIPSALEWEAACRADTRTNYWWGQDARHLLHQYVMTAHSEALNPILGVGARGQKFPNPLGIFDMIGNTAELTFAPDEEPIRRFRVYGGYTMNRFDYYESSYSHFVGQHSVNPTYQIGFRLILHNK